MSQRYKNCFAKLKQNNQGAFVPFVMLGDPDLETSYEVIKTLIDNGADALELGIPFSDPIADGPVIQAAAIRALSQQIRVKDCFQLLRRIRDEYSEIPIGLLLYSNLVVSNGIETFYQQVNSAGVDSVLVADVPILESAKFIKMAKRNQISPIFIATPNADDNTLKKVAELGQGYTYLLSRAGVTGTDIKAEMPVESVINKLKQYQAPPSLLGFGISTPKQVKQAIKNGADGAISGSAVVKLIQENLENKHKMLVALAQFSKNMKAASI